MGATFWGVMQPDIHDREPFSGVLKVTVNRALDVVPGKHVLILVFTLVFVPVIALGSENFSLVSLLHGYDAFLPYPSVLDAVLWMLFLLSAFQLINVVKNTLDFNSFYVNNCFVVVSQSHNTFKTKEKNQVWDQTFPFILDTNNAFSPLNFSLYSKRLLQTNKVLASVSISLNELLEVFKSQHQAEELPEDLIAFEKSLQKHNAVVTSSRRLRSNSFLNQATRSLLLPLQVGQNVNPSESKNPELLLTLEYVSKRTYELKFWNWLLGLFNNDGLGRIGLIELKAVLDVFKPESEALLKKAEEDSSLLSIESLVELIPAHISFEQLVSGSTCLICSKPVKDKYPRSNLLHLISCIEKVTSGQIFEFSQLHTVENASRGWMTKIFEGNVRPGETKGHICVVNRKTGHLIEEKIPGFVKFSMRILYQTKLRERLNAKAESYTQRLFMSLTNKIEKSYEDSSFDRQGNRKCKKTIEKFIKFHSINMEEVLNPDLDSYATFNQFFYRKLKPNARHVSSTKNTLISPADSRTAVFETVSKAQELWIKGRNFSIENLIGPAFAQDIRDIEFSVSVSRLAPQDYHRFHSPCAATVHKVSSLGGALFTVNPIAVRENIDVFTENKRVVVSLESEDFGRIYYICVGAVLVGSIVLTVEEGEPVAKGDEVGYFRFGGSTIIVLVEKNKVTLDNDLIANSERKLETLLQVGDSIGWRS